MIHGRVRGRCSGLTRAHHNRYETRRGSRERPLGTHRPPPWKRWLRRIKNHPLAAIISALGGLIFITDAVAAATKVAEWLHAVPWDAIASLISDLVPFLVEILIWIALLL